MLISNNRHVEGGKDLGGGLPCLSALLVGLSLNVSISSETNPSPLPSLPLSLSVCMSFSPSPFPPPPLPMLWHLPFLTHDTPTHTHLPQIWGKNTKRDQLGLLFTYFLSWLILPGLPSSSDPPVWLLGLLVTAVTLPILPLAGPHLPVLELAIAPLILILFY